MGRHVLQCHPVILHKRPDARLSNWDGHSIWVADPPWGFWNCGNLLGRGCSIILRGPLATIELREGNSMQQRHPGVLYPLPLAVAGCLRIAERFFGALGIWLIAVFLFCASTWSMSPSGLTQLPGKLLTHQNIPQVTGGSGDIWWHARVPTGLNIASPKRCAPRSLRLCHPDHVLRDLHILPGSTRGRYQTWR